MNPLMITSPAFEASGWIPNCHTGYGEDVSPELHVAGLLKEAVLLVITMDDLGHPIFPGYNHWVAWNLPAIHVVPGGLPKGKVIEQPIHIEQGLAYGKHGYRGPKPPFHWNHDYCFTVYALDTKLSISARAKKADVLKAAEGHILQMGSLVGKYQHISNK